MPAVLGIPLLKSHYKSHSFSCFLHAHYRKFWNGWGKETKYRSFVISQRQWPHLAFLAYSLHVFLKSHFATSNENLMEATPGSGGRSNEVFIHLSNMCAAQRERAWLLHLQKNWENSGKPGLVAFYPTELQCGFVTITQGWWVLFLLFFLSSNKNEQIHTYLKTWFLDLFCQSFIGHVPISDILSDFIHLILFMSLIISVYQ